MDTGGIFPEKIMMNTTLAAASGGIWSIFMKNRILGTHSRLNRYDLTAISNGILAGLVAITASCHNVESWAALVIGLIGSIFYTLSCKLLHKLKIDDPLEATNVHGFGGIAGLICAGLFD